MSWPTVQLSTVVVEAQPGFACGDSDPEGVAQFRMNNVTRDGAIDMSKVRRIPLKKTNLKKYALMPGDILFNITNSPNLVGKTAIVGQLSEVMVYSNHFLRIRTSRALDPRYATRWLQWRFSLGVFEALCHQWVNQATVSRDRLMALEIPLPPLPEQRRIAAILDHAETVRTSSGHILTKLGMLSQSIFHDMFSTFDWLARFDSIIASGPSNGLYRPASDYGAGVPILRIDGFASGAVLSNISQWKRLRADDSEIRRYSLAAGDLVVNRVNALSHLGKSALISAINEPAVYESNMMRIRIDPDRASNDFVLAWLQTERTKQQILRKAKKAINQASINQADVKSLLLPLPPLALQNRFAERVRAVEARRAVVERFVAIADELFATLQARAFRGEL